VNSDRQTKPDLDPDLKDETKDEEEEEEKTQVLLNRPPKRSRQEEKTAQGSTLLTPKVEGVPVTSSKDRFEAIC
jgi:hypothetical protein